MDLSQCKTRLSISDITNIILLISAHKRPGTTGIRGSAYKRQVSHLAQVFHEAWMQMQDESFDTNSVPPHINETLWIPIPKKAGANTVQSVRDLELPNEDTRFWSECAHTSSMSKQQIN